MNATHLLDDPYLAPYADAIRGRADHADARARELAPEGSLSDWASAHEYYGLHRGPRGWVFREFAPNATAITMVGDFSGWRKKPRYALKRVAASGVWELKLPIRALHHGQNYHLLVEWDGGAGERIPTYARRVVQDPVTKLFSAQVWSPRSAHRWKHASPPADGAAPLIYEAHVGMAQEEEKVGTWDEFREKVLPRVKAAGYNVLQLMAVMEHPYYGSFGYHVSSFFAASSRFGEPEGLKRLVDAAHGMGLRVIMDLVHSHAVKNERDGLSLFDGTPWLYFHDGAKGHHRAWDSRCFDYGRTCTLHFLLSNCRFWLDEYHFDGYRFDGVTSMLFWDHGLGEAFTDYSKYFNGSMDDDAWAYLRLANRVIHEVRPDALTIAEDVSGMPGCAAPLGDCGMGFDYRLAMGEPDHWFRLAGETRDEDWNMHGLFHALTDRRAEERVVSYVESHDQALVGGKTFFFQLVDAAIYHGMRVDQNDPAIERGIALHKMARLATLGCAGPGYLNFMGNEFGHPEWIDFPREGNGWSCSHARRQWSLRDDPALRFKALGDFDAAMLALAGPCRLEGNAVPLAVNDADHVLAFYRGGLVYVFNFDPTRSYVGYGLMVPPGPFRYRLALDTDELRFGGQGRIAPRQVFIPHGEIMGAEKIDVVNLYLPARTALVLERVRR